MELPITKNELEIIIKALKRSHPNLYSKLWTHKMNYLIKEKK